MNLKIRVFYVIFINKAIFLMHIFCIKTFDNFSASNHLKFFYLQQELLDKQESACVNYFIFVFFPILYKYQVNIYTQYKLHLKFYKKIFVQLSILTIKTLFYYYYFFETLNIKTNCRYIFEFIMLLVTKALMQVSRRIEFCNYH